MPDRCTYCGREEGGTDKDGFIHLLICPVCEAVACPICLCLVEFCEDIGDNNVQVWRAAICKVHLPWNIIEGIKKNVKEEDKDGESSNMSRL